MKGKLWALTIALKTNNYSVSKKPDRYDYYDITSPIHNIH